MSYHDPHEASNEPVLYGVLGEFKDPTALVKAAKKVRDAGFSRWDAHSPFPVHGLDPAMGIKPTILPWLVLGAGLTGLCGSLLMQWWMNSIDYPWIISGKPLFSLPAFVPVIFESTVLLAGLTAFIGMLVLNLLPEHYHPLFKLPRFKRATSDGFFIAIEALDPAFDLARTQELLKSAGAVAVDTVYGEPKKAWALPRGFLYGGIIAVCATLLPLVLIANARYTKSDQPRWHLIFDMDLQPKAKAQASSTFFTDGRAYRPPIAGTLAQGELNEDTHFHRGMVGEQYAADFPAQVELTDATMKRGQERYNVFCSPCHGVAGGGDGMVARRAEQLQEGTWVPPTSMHDPRVRSQPHGQIFTTITHGIRNMPAYSAQIPPADRWAIVLYVRALQRSQYAQLRDVPADVQPTLR